MSRRSNPQIPFFHFSKYQDISLSFAILLFSLILIAYMVFLLCLPTPSLQTFPSPSPTPSPALTNNTLTRPPDSPISLTYLIDISHSNAVALAQSQVAYLAHNNPITTQKHHRYISRLSELLASSVIDSATLILTPNNP